MDLYHILSRAQQAVIPDDVGNSYLFFGTVVAGGGPKRLGCAF